MTPSHRRASVVAHVEATEAPIADHVHLTLRLPPGVPDALPGQFMHLRPAGGGLAPLLRRPRSISASRLDGDKALWSAFFAQVGPGTDALAGLSKIVFSTTLQEPLSWPNTQLVNQDAVAR